MIYLFFLFFFISPFIYLQICPLCKKRPQNMLYLTGGYVMIMIFSLFYPDWIKGESLFLYLYLAVLSLEGVLILSWRMKKVKDDYLDATAFARVNNQPVVSIYIQKESTANTIKISQRIDKEIKTLTEILDRDIKITPTFNQAEYIH